MVAGPVEVRHGDDFRIFPGDAGGGELQHFTALELIGPQYVPILLLVVNTLEPGFPKHNPEELIFEGVTRKRLWRGGCSGPLKVVGAITSGRNACREEDQGCRGCRCLGRDQLQVNVVSGFVAQLRAVPIGG